MGERRPIYGTRGKYPYAQFHPCTARLFAPNIGASRSSGAPRRLKIETKEGEWRTSRAEPSRAEPSAGMSSGQHPPPPLPPSYGNGGSAGAGALEAAKRAGNINIHDSSHTAVMELSEESREAMARHEGVMKRVEAEKRARTIAVPTMADEVRAALRALGEPVCLFGEGPADVRARLRSTLALLEVEAGEEGAEKGRKALLVAAGRGSAAAMDESGSGADEDDESAAVKDEVVYSVASAELMSARKIIASHSISRARQRLLGAKRRRDDEEVATAMDDATWATWEAVGGTGIVASALGDDRPLTCIRFSADGSRLSSGSWSGTVKVWQRQGLGLQQSLLGHTERVTSVAWHPSEGQQGLLASGACDKTAKIWKSSTGECLRTLEGHADRLARLEFHPCGAFVGTASFDHTWRLWDVETGTQLLLQDGHAHEVYSLSFQVDGALVATGDFGGAVRFWDLRTGKTVWNAVGHVDRITCSDFSANGFELATGSNDHTVRIWDLRKRISAYTLPAHAALISDVRFSKSGEVLLTTSFDMSVKAWGARDFRLLRTLRGHDNKVTACDMSSDEKFIASASFDKTIKLWACEAPIKPEPCPQ
jgi:U4/U6 small nuclear ribonucleoprotein PRP4